MSISRTIPRHNGRRRMMPTGAAGRAPPADLDAERCCLGSILLDGARLPEVAAVVSPDDFFDERHQRLMGHLVGMRAVGVAPDLVLLLDRLRASGDLAEVGGEAYLAELVASVGAPSHAVKYGAVVRRHAQRRAIIRAAEAAAWRAYEDGAEPSAIAAELGASMADAATICGPSNDRLRFIREILTSTELLTLDLRTDYLVHGIVAKGQPLVVGGRSKTMKTSVTIDLVLSLGSGTPFLGKFESQQVNVGFWSGESGAATICETAKRIAAAKGINLRDASVLWSFELPKLGVADHIAAMEKLIVERGLDVIVVDPLYLSLLDAKTASGAGNLFTMGASLSPLSELAQRTKCTPIVLHHFRKNGPTDDDEPAGLPELSQAGVGEWARQWVLLQRRSAYQHDGNHRLFMRTGGSAGHAGLWGVDIEEGTIPNRYWEASVQPIADTREEVRRAAEQRKADAAERKEDGQRKRLHTTMRQFAAGETVRTLRAAAGLNGDAFARAIHTMIQRGEAEPCEVTKRQGTYEGFRLTREGRC